MTQTQEKTDRDLKDSIALELDWTPSVASEHIGVGVTNGAVTLSGQVGSYPEKRAAVRAATLVHGVTAVADEIEVHHAWGVPDDADIAREVDAAFARSTVVPKGAVKAEVHDRTITLTGTVDWQYQRQAAQHAIADLPGVKAVWNSITLKPKLVVSPTEAKAKITAALVRNAQTDAAKIHVAVNGRDVVLTGTVSSLGERRQAENAAWYAPGVTSVENLLHVGV